jgi:undecaprenyl-diphosphatase
MDASAFDAMNRLAARTGWLHSPVVAYAKYGIVLFAVALAVGWWLARQRHSIEGIAAVVTTAVAVFVALAVAQMLGHVLDRARPYDSLPAILVLVDRTRDFSFPSDHATAVGAVAAGLWFVDRRLGASTAVLAMAMAIARVYVGAHYPGDVLAGLALGGLTAVAVHRLLAGPVTSVLERLRSTPIRPLITSEPAV